MILCITYLHKQHFLFQNNSLFFGTFVCINDCRAETKVSNVIVSVSNGLNWFSIERCIILNGYVYVIFLVSEVYSALYCDCYHLLSKQKCFKCVTAVMKRLIKKNPGSLQTQGVHLHNRHKRHRNFLIIEYWSEII